jgi:hypothetical protein
MRSSYILRWIFCDIAWNIASMRQIVFLLSSWFSFLVDSNEHVITITYSAESNSRDHLQCPIILSSAPLDTTSVWCPLTAFSRLPSSPLKNIVKEMRQVSKTHPGTAWYQIVTREGKRTDTLRVEGQNQRLNVIEITRRQLLNYQYRDSVINALNYINPTDYLHLAPEILVRNLKRKFGGKGAQ